MRFSWTGLILAPLLVPLMFCAVMLSLLQTNGSIAVFLILLVPSCVVSYGTTIFLFLPSLFLLSLWRPMTGLTACLLGLILGAVVFVPLTLLEWKSSGPDSGPPAESFWAFFLRWAADPMTAVYPTAGLVTAGLYWWLGTWRRGWRSPDFHFAAVSSTSALRWVEKGPSRAHRRRGGFTAVSGPAGRSTRADLACRAWSAWPYG